MAANEETPSRQLTSKQCEALNQVSEIMLSKLKIFSRVFLGVASPRVAIRAMCLQCCQGEHAAIRDCSGEACALWRYRPYVRDANSVGRDSH